MYEEADLCMGAKLVTKLQKERTDLAQHFFKERYVVTPFHA